MAVFHSPGDVDGAWEILRTRHVGLPPELRPPQRDALYWLLQDKSVVICIGTGVVIYIESNIHKLTHFDREWQDIGCLDKYPALRQL